MKNEVVKLVVYVRAIKKVYPYEEVALDVYPSTIEEKTKALGD